MKNTRDIDHTIDDSEEQHVRSNWIPAITGTNIVASSALAWIGGDRLDGSLQLANVAFGLAIAPILRV